MAIQKLNNRHRRMMEALVVEGKKPVEVSIEFDISESRLSILRRSPLWKAEEDALAREVRDQFKLGMLRLVPRCIDREESLIDSADERVALSAIKDVLNRAGVVGEKFVEAGSGCMVRVVLED